MRHNTRRCDLFIVVLTFADVTVALNDDFRFVLQSSEVQTLVGVSFESASGSLDPGTSPDPFQFFLGAATPNQVTLGSVGATVTIQGSLELSTGWNFLSGRRDVFHQVGIFGKPAEPLTPLADAAYRPCPECAAATVSVSATGAISLAGFAGDVTGVRLLSPGGWLVPVSDPAPFSIIEANTSNEVILRSEQPVSAEELLQLPVAWNVAGEQDIQLAYDTAKTADIGPFALPADAYIPEPSASVLICFASLAFVLFRRRKLHTS